MVLFTRLYKDARSTKHTIIGWTFSFYFPRGRDHICDLNLEGNVPASALRCCISETGHLEISYCRFLVFPLIVANFLHSLKFRRLDEARNTSPKCNPTSSCCKNRDNSVHYVLYDRGIAVRFPPGNICFSSLRRNGFWSPPYRFRRLSPGSKAAVSCSLETFV